MDKEIEMCISIWRPSKQHKLSRKKSQNIVFPRIACSLDGATVWHPYKYFAIKFSITKKKPIPITLNNSYKLKQTVLDNR